VKSKDIFVVRYNLAGGQRDSSPETVMTIWAYEANRLFRDRLVGEETCTKFDNILVTIIRNDWSVNVIDSLASKWHFYCNYFQVLFKLVWFWLKWIIEIVRSRVFRFLSIENVKRMKDTFRSILKNFFSSRTFSQETNIIVLLLRILVAVNLRIINMDIGHTLLVLIGAAVCLLAAEWVQSFTVTGNGWPCNAPWNH